MVDLTYDCSLAHWLYHGGFSFLDIGIHIGYLHGLFCRYPESDKGQTTHNLYGGLPL
jgi:hypothetical protein